MLVALLALVDNPVAWGLFSLLWFAIAAFVMIFVVGRALEPNETVSVVDELGWTDAEATNEQNRMRERTGRQTLEINGLRFAIDNTTGVPERNLAFEPPVGTPIWEAFEGAVDYAKMHSRRIACRLGFGAYIVEPTDSAAELVAKCFRDQITAIEYNPVAHRPHYEVEPFSPELCSGCGPCGSDHARREPMSAEERENALIDIAAETFVALCEEAEKARAADKV